jgi:hypothetical protein
LRQNREAELSSERAVTIQEIQNSLQRIQEAVGVEPGAEFALQKAPSGAEKELVEIQIENSRDDAAVRLVLLAAIVVGIYVILRLRGVSLSGSTMLELLVCFGIGLSIRYLLYGLPEGRNLSSIWKWKADY